MDLRNQRKRSAIIYQSLYLMNLLLIPGIAFVILLWLFAKENATPGWQRIHLFRSLQLSILAGLFIVIVPLTVVFTTNQLEASIMVMVVYLVTIHAAFVMLGMLNVARAMARKLPLF